MSAQDVVANMNPVPQSQDSLIEQLRVLRIAANKLGLYDAADFLTQTLSAPVRKREKVKVVLNNGPLA